MRSATGIAGPSIYLTASDQCERYHCSRMWITRHFKQHQFPKPIKFGPGISAPRRWLRDAALAWQAEREAMASQSYGGTDRLGAAQKEVSNV
jgi:predicted DNA-binding transcriptional regulator AlpA